MRTINFKSVATTIVFLIMISGAGFSQTQVTLKDTLGIQDDCQSVPTIYYTCPIHSKVRSEKPGNCPQCGMTMNKRKDVTYYCPIHTEIQQDEKGKCEKCDKDLEKKE